MSEAGTYTWAGRYAGARAGLQESEQIYLGQGAYPGEVQGISRQVGDRVIPPGKPIDVEILPKVVIRKIDAIPSEVTVFDVEDKVTTVPGSSFKIIVDADTKIIQVPGDDVITRTVPNPGDLGIGKRVRVRKPWSPRRGGGLEGLWGGEGKRKYEERLNPFDSILEMGQPHRHRHGHGRKSRGSGLLWAIATALAGLFVIYFIVSLMLPAIGMLDYHVFNFMNHPNIPFSATYTFQSPYYGVFNLNRARRMASAFSVI
ncbi:MAG: hypothetical protein QHG94_08570, partial [Candidatus Methanosuratincola sp.]|nr:hypothetical protein [Candidatus Methanosuratincola sp.]